MTGIKRFRMVGLGLLMVVAVGACASTDHSVRVQAGSSAPAGATPVRMADAKLVLSAARAADAVTSGRFVATFTLATNDAGTVTMHGSGAFDRAAKAVQVDVGATTGGSDSVALSAVLADGTAYLKLGDLGKPLGIDTPWLSIDVANLAAAHPFPGTAQPAPGTTDPQTFLDLLKGVSGSVVTLGTERVGGAATTHLRADVIPSQAIAKLPQDRQDALRRLFGSALDTPIPVEVWVDAGGQLRKGSIRYDLGSLGSLSATFELDAVDQPVAIAVPPADQVTAAADVALLAPFLGGH